MSTRAKWIIALALAIIAGLGVATLAHLGPFVEAHARQELFDDA